MIYSESILTPNPNPNRFLFLSLSSYLNMQHFSNHSNQIEEIIKISKVFPEIDRRRLASRALFICDPDVALNWQPLSQPLPVMPSVQQETVLSCVLRTYSTRKDVTSFFRATYQPILRSIYSVVSSNEVTGSRTFMNIVTTAERIIETTFLNQVICNFPPSATAVCQSLFQIGGNDALHTYMFNYLILPNIIKVFQGDHESVENEMAIRLDDITSLSNKYYAIDSWWPVQGFDSVAYNAMNTLLWVTWKLYSGASLINQADIEVLESSEFFKGHPVELDLKAVSSKKLRILLLRAQRRIDYGCQCLLRLPLDKQGSRFLNIDPSGALQELSAYSNTIPKKAIDRRMQSISHLKAPDMLTLLVIGE